MKKPSARSNALNEYVDQLEARIEKEPKLLERTEYKQMVTLVSAQLLPESVPFRSVDLECWAHFEQARRELKEGKHLRAAQAAERWQVCLIAKDDELLQRAAPFLRCLGLLPKK